jgi:hypothetical protein
MDNHFTLEDRFKSGNFTVKEICNLKPVSNSRFYEDLKCGRVIIQKHGRRSLVPGPIAKKYIQGEPKIRDGILGNAGARV